MGKEAGKAVANISREQADPRINPLIWAAIEHRRLIRLAYKNRERIVEPHDYGVHKGTVKLLAYQVSGVSSGKLPNWRWMEQEWISDIEILDQSFAGGRRTPTGKHHNWDKLFLRVKAASEKA